MLSFLKQKGEFYSKTMGLVKTLADVESISVIKAFLPHMLSLERRLEQFCIYQREFTEHRDIKAHL